VDYLVRTIYAFASVSGLGILFGVGLAVASKILAVQKNERVAQLEEALPGLNCGACGFAGCSSYAGALAETDPDAEDAPSPTLCLPGGPETAQSISEILGIEVEVSVQKMVAQVHCRGSRQKAETSYLYAGVQDCNALHAMYGGDKVCPYGCLGLGSCIEVCPVEAIDYDREGLVWVDREKCISCRKCVDICPTGVMQMIPYEAEVMVACHSTDKGPVVRKYCSVGCIGCKLCERKSPEGGFKVDNFLAGIDYNQTGSRKEAVEACPTKCIISTRVESKVIIKTK
jgi:Na+-translocating ferredoxin:NAD+ oxidoreductase RNF subunit RnfB